jgi:hypothetical protein
MTGIKHPASALQQQLLQVSKKHRALHDDLERKNVDRYGPNALVPSILYDALVAADQDAEFIYEQAIEGLQELSKDNAWWTDYVRNQLDQTICFGKGALVDRAMLTVEESKKVDAEVLLVLKALSPYYKSCKGASKVLEFLIRRLRIHYMNIDALVASVLPMHETMSFFRILQVLPLDSTDGNESMRWSFLSQAQKRKVNAETGSTDIGIPRSFLVSRCLSDPSLIIFIFSFLESIQKNSSLATAHDYRAYMSFYACLFVQVIKRSTAKQIRMYAMPWLTMTLQALKHQSCHPHWQLTQWLVIQALSTKIPWSAFSQLNETGQKESALSIILLTLIRSCLHTNRVHLIAFLSLLYMEMSSNEHTPDSSIGEILFTWTEPSLLDVLKRLLDGTSEGGIKHVFSGTGSLSAPFLVWLCCDKLGSSARADSFRQVFFQYLRANHSNTWEQLDIHLKRRIQRKANQENSDILSEYSILLSYGHVPNASDSMVSGDAKLEYEKQLLKLHDFVWDNCILSKIDDSMAFRILSFLIEVFSNIQKNLALKDNSDCVLLLIFEFVHANKSNRSLLDQFYKSDIIPADTKSQYLESGSDLILGKALLSLIKYDISRLIHFTAVTKPSLDSSASKPLIFAPRPLILTCTVITELLKDQKAIETSNLGNLCSFILSKVDLFHHSMEQILVQFLKSTFNSISSQADLNVSFSRKLFSEHLVTLPCTSLKASILQLFFFPTLDLKVLSDPTAFLKYFWFDHIDEFTKNLDQILILQDKIIREAPISSDLELRFSFVVSVYSSQFVRSALDSDHRYCPKKLLLTMVSSKRQSAKSNCNALFEHISQIWEEINSSLLVSAEQKDRKYSCSILLLNYLAFIIHTCSLINNDSTLKFDFSTSQKSSLCEIASRLIFAEASHTRLINPLADAKIDLACKLVEFLLTFWHPEKNSSASSPEFSLMQKVLDSSSAHGSSISIRVLHEFAKCFTMPISNSSIYGMVLRAYSNIQRDDQLFKILRACDPIKHSKIISDFLMKSLSNPQQISNPDIIKRLVPIFELILSYDHSSLPIVSYILEFIAMFTEVFAGSKASICTDKNLEIYEYSTSILLQILANILDTQAINGSHEVDSALSFEALSSLINLRAQVIISLFKLSNIALQRKIIRCIAAMSRFSFTQMLQASMPLFIFVPTSKTLIGGAMKMESEEHVGTLVELLKALILSSGCDSVSISLPNANFLVSEFMEALHSIPTYKRRSIFSCLMDNLPLSVVQMLIQAFLDTHDSKTNSRLTANLFSSMDFCKELLLIRSAGVFDSISILFSMLPTLSVSHIHHMLELLFACVLAYKPGAVESGHVDVSLYFKILWELPHTTELSSGTLELLGSTIQQLVLKRFVSQQQILKIVFSQTNSTSDYIRKLLSYITLALGNKTYRSPLSQEHLPLLSMPSISILLKSSFCSEYLDLSTAIINSVVSKENVTLDDQVLDQYFDAVMYKWLQQLVPLDNNCSLLSIARFLSMSVECFGTRLFPLMKPIMEWLFSKCNSDFSTLYDLLLKLLYLWTPLLTPYYERLLDLFVANSDKLQLLWSVFSARAERRHWVPLLSDKILKSLSVDANDNLLIYLGLFENCCKDQVYLQANLSIFHNVILGVFLALARPESNYDEAIFTANLNNLLTCISNLNISLQNDNEFGTLFCQKLISELLSSISPNASLKAVYMVVKVVETCVTHAKDGSLDIVCFFHHLSIYSCLLQNIKDEDDILLSRTTSCVQNTLNNVLAHCKPQLLLYYPTLVDDLSTIFIEIFLERVSDSVFIQRSFDTIFKKLLKLQDQGKEKIRLVHQLVLDSTACRSKNGTIRAQFLAALSGSYTGVRRDTDLLTCMLPDAVPFIAELVEDECELVERQSHSLISTLEEILGDDLKTFLQ